MTRVLILEDEKVVARDLEGILGTLGYETSLAASGEEAIEIAKREKPEVALVDIHLAGALDGIETAQIFREMDVGVVYLTAHSDESTLRRAEGTAPLGYLVKPFVEPTLRATIQMAVHKAGLERQNRAEQKWRTTVLDQLTVGLVTADTAGCVTMINLRGQQMTDWPEGEALHKKVTEIVVLRGADRDSVTAEVLESAMRGEAAHAGRRPWRLVARSGNEAEVEVRATPILDEGEHVAGLALVFWPTAAPKPPSMVPAATADEPDCDPLTGLPGRAQAKAAIEASMQGQTKLFAAVFVLDRYYFTARKYGSAIADEVLTYYCTFLAQEVQAQPHYRGLFRWTGPCFLAVFGPWESALMAQREVARCTRNRLVEEFQAGSHTVLLPVSASVKVIPLSEAPLQGIVSQVDAFVALRTKGEQV